MTSFLGAATVRRLGIASHESMFTFDFEDEEENEELFKRAEELAKVSSAQYPLFSEHFFLGAIYAALRMTVSVTINGFLFRFPSMAPTDAYRETERLVSFETMLPLGLSASDAKMLADRFRGLAALCDRIASR